LFQFYKSNSIPLTHKTLRKKQTSNLDFGLACQNVSKRSWRVNCVSQEVKVKKQKRLDFSSFLIFHFYYFSFSIFTFWPFIYKKKIENWPMRVGIPNSHVGIPDSSVGECRESWSYVILFNTCWNSRLECWRVSNMCWNVQHDTKVAAKYRYFLVRMKSIDSIV